MGALEQVASATTLRPEVQSVLNEADLVKFAKATPSREDCNRTLATAEKIVRTTTPVQRVDPPASPVGTPSAGEQGSKR